MTADAGTAPATAEPMFTLQFDGDRAGQPLSRPVLLKANRSDASMCDWLAAAKVGESERFGDRCYGCTVRRVA